MYPGSFQAMLVCFGVGLGVVLCLFALLCINALIIDAIRKRQRSREQKHIDEADVQYEEFLAGCARSRSYYPQDK